MPVNDEIPEDRLADFTRDKRILLLSALAFVIGILGAFVAKILIWLIAVITNLVFFQHFSSQTASLAHIHLGLWVIGIPAVGGLVIGLMARYGSEKIRGHGIPEALEAILFGRSRIDAKVAVLKPISSAISIGTGGPFGAEGPIIMTGGAVGSLFAQLFHLSPAERKTLLVAGAAAGMSAVFATPVAAVLLAIELLLFEWRPRSFVPVAVASAVAAALRIPLLGAGPIFPVVPHAPASTEQLCFAFIVGIIAGLGSCVLTVLVYRCEDLFHKLPIHWMWWPTMGGLLVGVIGWMDPRALGVGYELIHGLLQGNILGLFALGLVLSKSLAWAIALGSGTSGGVLAPLLMMGGALGAMESSFIPIGDAGLWAAVSMAAMMGGTMRSPLTAMLFALELTHDTNLFLSLLIGCTAAYLVTVLLMRRSILTEKIARRGFHIMREYSVDPLAMIRVGDVMDRNIVGIPQDMSIQELSAHFLNGDSLLTRHQGMPIINDKGKLVGIITRSDILRVLEQEPVGDILVIEAGNTNVIVAYPDEPLSEVLYRMLRNNIGRLPVVSRTDVTQLLGYLGRSAIISARSRQVEDEHTREPGWFQRRSVS